jgi:hypothetical protein
MPGGKEGAIPGGKEGARTLGVLAEAGGEEGMSIAVGTATSRAHANAAPQSPRVAEWAYGLARHDAPHRGRHRGAHRHLPVPVRDVA